MQEEITAVEEDAVPASESDSAPVQIEALLTADIARLWANHVQVRSAARRTKEELRDLRNKLGEKLCELKKVLAVPGRAGRWSAFLKEQRLPRTTSDRLISKHAQANGLGVDNCTSGAITQDATGRELALKRVLAKLTPILTADQAAVCDFAQELAKACGVRCKQTADGVLVYRLADPDSGAVSE